MDCFNKHWAFMALNATNVEHKVKVLGKLPEVPILLKIGGQGRLNLKANAT